MQAIGVCKVGKLPPVHYTYGACFHAGPTKGSTIHHVIFANNVANGCMGGGFNSYNSSTSASVDYIVYIGNIAYNGAQGSGACYSGLNIYQPIASDKNAGTHMYIAGNFSYNNVDGSPCSGGLTTDGEGINLDTFDFSQGGGPAYTQQAVVENNISVSNGSSGVLIENNKTGSSAAPVYFKYNTTYGNLKATNRSFCVGLGEIYAEAANNVTVTNNLEVTDAATGCQGDAIYAASVANSSARTRIKITGSTQLPETICSPVTIHHSRLARKPSAPTRHLLRPRFRARLHAPARPTCLVAWRR